MADEIKFSVEFQFRNLEGIKESEIFYNHYGNNGWRQCTPSATITMWISWATGLTSEFTGNVEDRGTC